MKTAKAYTDMSHTALSPTFAWAWVIAFPNGEVIGPEVLSEKTGQIRKSFPKRK